MSLIKRKPVKDTTTIWTVYPGGNQKITEIECISLSIGHYTYDLDGMRMTIYNPENSFWFRDRENAVSRAIIYRYERIASLSKELAELTALPPIV